MVNYKLVLTLRYSVSYMKAWLKKTKRKFRFYQKVLILYIEMLTF